MPMWSRTALSIRLRGVRELRERQYEYRVAPIRSGRRTCCGRAGLAEFRSGRPVVITSSAGCVRGHAGRWHDRRKACGIPPALCAGGAAVCSSRRAARVRSVSMPTGPIGDCSARTAMPLDRLAGRRMPDVVHGRRSWSTPVPMRPPRSSLPSSRSGCPRCLVAGMAAGSVAMTAADARRAGRGHAIPPLAIDSLAVAAEANVPLNGAALGAFRDLPRRDRRQSRPRSSSASRT